MGFLEVAVFVAVVIIVLVHQILASIRKKTAGWSAIKHTDIIDSPLFSRYTLALLRLSIASFQLFGIFNRVIFGRVVQHCNEDETRCVPYGGPYLLTTFTVWSWCLQALYFLVTGIAGLSPSLLAKRRGAVFSLWVLFEVSFAISLLVFLVVWVVLIPSLEYKAASGTDFEVMAAQRGLKMFFSFWALCFHNLNVVFMGLELAVNALPFRRAHAPFAALYGVCYVCFSWVFHHYTGVWYYFFLDYNRPYPVVSYGLLLLLLGAFFAFGAYIANEVKPRALARVGLLEAQMTLRSRDTSRDTRARDSASPPRSRPARRRSSRTEQSEGSPSPAARRRASRSGRPRRRSSGAGAGSEGKKAGGGAESVVGEVVMGLHESGGWYDATVTKAEGQTYVLRWHDGDTSDRVKTGGEVMSVDSRGPFSAGDRVMAAYGEEGWHAAQLVRRRGRKWEVEWEDGDVQDTVKGEHELRRKARLV